MSKKAPNKTSKKAPASWQWIAVALVLLATAAGAGIYWSSTMKVSSVQFEGNYYVPKQKLSSIQIPTGINPDSINFAKIIGEFERISYVKQADISVDPGGGLTIHIQERQPVALLVDGSHKIYVDKDGIKLQRRQGKAANVPILYGFSAKPRSDTLKSNAFKTTANFLTKIQQRPMSDATISEVTWTADKGVVALTNQNGVKLIVGKDDFDARLRNWEAFYGSIIKQKGIEVMRSVDLRFKGQIVTRET